MKSHHSHPRVRALRRSARERNHLGVRIERGTYDDYRALEHYHYRPGRPSIVVEVWRATARGALGPIGVLTISMPALNAWWRAGAWREFAACDPRSRRGIRMLNARVRTISRVIVDPRFRGLGVGSTLVRAYLARARTARTEALASMGRYCPMFERAGMRRIDRRVHARADRFARVLGARAVPAWRLMDEAFARRLYRRDARVRRAVRAWARAGRDTRGAILGPALLMRAAAGIAAPPVAYVHP